MSGMFRALIGLTGLALATVAVEPPTFPPGKLFSHKTANSTLGAVLTELEKQTGVAIDRSEAELDRTLKLNCVNLPFWNALDQIARESDHQIAVSEDGKRLRLRGGGEIVYREVPSSVDRVFRVTARRVRATADLEADRTYVEIGLMLNWEPGIQVFLVEQPGRSATARDNTDQEIRVSEDGGGRVPAGGNGVELALRLNGVPRSSRSIKTLEGKFGVVGAASTLEFTFDDVMAAADAREIRKDGVAVRVRTDFKAGSDLWTARVEFEYPEGGPALESYESAAWLIDNQAWLASRDGKTRIDNNGGYEVISQGDRKAVVLYRFTDDTNVRLGAPDQWSLRLRTPSRLLATDVKFKLENIPLP